MVKDGVKFAYLYSCFVTFSFYILSIPHRSLMGQEEVYHFIKQYNRRLWMKEIIASQDTDPSSTREYLKRLKDKQHIKLGRQGREVYFWIDASCKPFYDAMTL